MHSPLIFDSSALFNFGHRGNLAHILTRLKEEAELLIPPHVKKEVTRKRPDVYEPFITNFFSVNAPDPSSEWNQLLADAASFLGTGELEVLSLTIMTKGTAVIDERAARRVAKDADLTVTGTVGILDHAIRFQWMNESEAIIAVRQLIAAGFRIGDPAKRSWSEYVHWLKKNES